MTTAETDRELLEEAFRAYDEAFAAHVGEIVTPEEYLDDEEQLAWLARVFVFAYGLGSVAGARFVAEGADAEADAERVERIVDDVVSIHESDAFAASAERVAADLRAD